ncbi:unnamed protein product [Cuscuta europaea]|uniref:HTH OST-type domain-containing protein n=1 Tax=Cuscuta europaea TaxID=41803 RepID=A0A9P0YPJ0_CUSEU|nr:unnamed protein product [Cuscuta europaea]
MSKMRPVFSRPLFTIILHSKNDSAIITRKKLFQFAPFSTATSQSSHHSSYQSRRNEEDVRNVKVSVWWDFENCTLPPGVNVFRVAHSITAAVRASGIKGPIQITAFGDIVQLPRANQEALSSTGINLTHIPNGGKSSADRSLLVDLMYWVSQNPPPAHLFLISGDSGFAGVLHRLRMNNYNILLAGPEKVSGSLYSAASIMWQWNALLRGEDLTGKHFNHPPDGPYGSWYGHYKAPLEDPFAVMESPHTEDPSSDSKSDPNPRPIPKAVLKYIRHILGSNSKGILITDLRAELAKSNLSIDKDFYGYKKFSRFLLSMPQILKLQPSGNQLLVHGVNSKTSEQNECGSLGIPVDPTGIVGESQSAVSRNRPNNTNISSAESSTGTVLPTPYSVQKVETMSQKVQDPSTKVIQCPLPKAQEHSITEKTPLARINVTKTEVSGSQLHSTEDSSSHVHSQGILKGFWRKWFGARENDAKEVSSNSSDEIPAEQKKVKEPDVKLMSPSENIKSLDHSLHSGAEEKIDDKTTASSHQYIVDKSSRESGFFNRIWSWFGSRKSPCHEDNSNPEPDKKTTEDKPGSLTHEIFSKDSFWKDMEAFLDSKQGSTLVIHSRTRLQLSQNLKAHGPSVLRSLCDSDLLHLVDLLISDKKWVEERIHRTFPFKLSQPAVKAVVNDASSHSSTGLSGLFQHTHPLTNSLEKSQEQDGENNKRQNPPNSVSPPILEESSFGGKSRNDILIDCMKLVQDVVKEYPEGYNVGSFRKLFLETHGYSLDLQKLGYQKLVNLLNIIPGIRVESNHIIPSGKVVPESPTTDEFCFKESSSDRKMLLDASRKKVDYDVGCYSTWAEELGPISKKKTKKVDEIEYEPLSDDDDDGFSDLDEEKTKPEETSRKAVGTSKEEESSLLQILDSWYSRKEGIVDDGEVTVVECSSKPLSSSSSSSSYSNVDTTSTVLMNSSSGKRSCRMGSKSYSFVSDDQTGDCRDEVLEGILNSLNKSEEKPVAGPKT